MIKESIKMSFRNIINNKVRSLLTVLGVLIGVSAIVALISIVQGVTDSITSQVMDMGANKISVQARGTVLKSGLTISELEMIAEIDNIKGVSPSISGKSSAVYDGNLMEDVLIDGKNDVHFANTKDLLQSGRAINRFDVESKNRVCLLGRNVVSELFYAQDPIDKEILINGASYLVVGTLQEGDSFAAGGNGDTIIIPYTSAITLLENAYITSVDVYMGNEQYSKATTLEIEAVLDTAFNNKEDAYSVTNMQNILDTVAEMTGTMTMMLAGIACISLVVGGIGIMNMMLVTVSERTSEIGLRKALGAEPKTIQWQFILEALFLSLFGGALGLAAGISVAFLASVLIGTKFIVAGYSLALAIGFSAIIGLVFGFTPAKKASMLNPIDALRRT